MLVYTCMNRRLYALFANGCTRKGLITHRLGNAHDALFEARVGKRHVQTVDSPLEIEGGEAALIIVHNVELLECDFS